MIKNFAISFGKQFDQANQIKYMAIAAYLAKLPELFKK